MADQLHEFRVRYPYVAFAAVVLAVVAVLTIQSCQIKENQRTIDRLKQAEAAQAADRTENRQRFANADLALCVEIEALKKRERDRALESFRDLDETLALLELEKTPEIVAVATRNRDRALTRFAAIKGGCKTLPSNR